MTQSTMSAEERAALVRNLKWGFDPSPTPMQLRETAADEIEALATENSALRERAETAERERDDMEEQRDDARSDPWPEWTARIIKTLESYGVEVVDYTIREIVDFGDAFDDWFREAVANETDRAEAAESALAEAQATISAARSEGIAAAARYVASRAQDYHDEHGSHDPSTGITEYPGTGDEYMGELAEIEEGIRALSDSQPGAAAPRMPQKLRAKDLTDEELRAEHESACSAFDACHEGDGHSGSPGEWAWERSQECESEMKRRSFAPAADEVEGGAR